MHTHPFSVRTAHRCYRVLKQARRRVRHAEMQRVSMRFAIIAVTAFFVVPLSIVQMVVEML